MTLSLRQVGKRFGAVTALGGVDLEVEDGELLALLGPSGSGKTTLLRVIAGLDAPDAGAVMFDGADMTRTPAARRRVGFVFQQYALFRHMNVAANIGYGLRVQPRADRPAATEIAARVADLLRLVELEGLERRHPGQLSGGQRQRVALARALAVNPRVLLLDEPFGALDATVRAALRRELRRIHDATGVTTVFVTHDQDEALELADRVAVLNRGRIEQVGTPAQVHDAPASAFVCGFVGESNRLEGRAEGGRFRAAGLDLAAAGLADGPAVAFVRPHDLALDVAGASFSVRRVAIQGPLGRIEGVLDDGRPLEIAVSRAEAAALHEGQSVGVTARAAHVFAV